MAAIDVSKHYDAPVERVFEVLTDLERAAERISGIVRLDVLTDGPVGKGTRWAETRRMFGRECTETMEITEFDPPRSYRVTATSHGCRYETEFRFEPVEDGTVVHVTFEAIPLTRIAKLLAFLSRPMLKACAKAFTADLDDLERAITTKGESRRDSGSTRSLPA